MKQAPTDAMDRSQAKQPLGHVVSAKYIDAEKGQVLTTEFLKQRFPHLTFTGEIQETGLLGVKRETNDFEVFVRHPKWVPTIQTDGTITFGGQQTEEHLIYLLGQTYGEQAIQIAQAVLSALKKGDEIPYKALQVGKELESVAHDKATGTILRLGNPEQFEFQAGIHEDALPPCSSVSEAILFRTEQITRRAQEHPDMLLMDTSVPLAGSPNDEGMQLNNGDGGNYIRPWAERLKEHLIFADSKAVATLNTIAHTYGYEDYNALMEERGFQVLWPSVACQTSYGMPHLREGGRLHIPLELAVATADIFNSNLGAIADMLMASSPLIFGLAPSPVRDHRMRLRYIFEGAWPAPFIETVATLKKRWLDGGITGMLYTIDRLAFQMTLPGRAPYAMIYGSAKIRVETKDLQAPLGRVENTIAGASPSLLDEIAHDSFLYILTIAAFEAAAHGQHPKTYWERYPSITRWKQRKLLTECFNEHGGSHPKVHLLIKESLLLLADLKANYPALGDMITFVMSRIGNLQVPSVANLEAYIKQPKGPISEVMLTMFGSGSDALRILRDTHRYQMVMAEIVGKMATKPDFFRQLQAYFDSVA